MFNTFQQACTAITNNCSGQTTFITTTPTVSIGTSLYTDNNASTLAGTGFAIKNGMVYQIVNGVVTNIQNCSTPNLTEQRNVYIGNPGLYNEASLYDNVLNKFPLGSNILTSVFTSNGFNIGSQVYKNGNVLFGTGSIVQLQTSGLLKINLVNGVISSTSSVISPIPLTNPLTTKILAPYSHYQNGNNIGTGYAYYDSNTEAFLWWVSKLNIASDGLTISETILTDYYWKFNKEQVSNGSLTNFKIPDQYKGTIVEIELIKNDLSNSFFYTILVGK